MDKSKAYVKSAFDVSVDLLSFKDRTVKELHDRLKRKGYSEDEIDIAIEKLYEYGYVNDSRYALLYIKSNIDKKGVNLIKLELSKKGISKEIISFAFDEIEEDYEYDSYLVCLDILKRKYYNANFSDEKILRRASSYMIRRGFTFEDINKALRTIKNMS